MLDSIASLRSGGINTEANEHITAATLKAITDRRSESTLRRLFRPEQLVFDPTFLPRRRIAGFQLKKGIAGNEQVLPRHDRIRGDVSVDSAVGDVDARGDGD